MLRPRLRPRWERIPEGPLSCQQPLKDPLSTRVGLTTLIFDRGTWSLLKIDICVKPIYKNISDTRLGAFLSGADTGFQKGVGSG